MKKLKYLVAMLKQSWITASIIVALIIIISIFSEIFWFNNSYMLFYVLMLVWILWQLRQHRLRLSSSTTLYSLVKQLRDEAQLRILYLSPIESNRWIVKLFRKIRNQHTLALYVIRDQTDIVDFASKLLDSEIRIVISAKEFFNLKLKGMIGTESETVANKALKYIGVKLRLST